MKVLITGGNGQLGTALKEFYPNAIFTTRSELDLLNPNLTDKIREIDPDLIINTAAVVGKVDLAEKEPLESIEVNASAVFRMLKGMKKPNFIQISSDYVNSNNIYGITKKLSEQIVLNQGGLVIRTCWLFGNGNNWVKWTLDNCEKPLTICDDQYARPTYARDLARMIKEHQNDTGILQIQNQGLPVSWYEYAQIVCNHAGKMCSFTPISTDEYRETHPEVAERPFRSVWKDFKGMPDWIESLNNYLGTIT